jgi:FAD synthase
VPRKSSAGPGRCGARSATATSAAACSASRLPTSVSAAISSQRATDPGRGERAANIGRRPTVADTLESRLEVNLFDFDDDLYGQELSVSLHTLLRAERKFDGLDALKAQIALDAAWARDYLRDR